MPAVSLVVILQIVAVVHLFRTGRNMTWLFLIILVPLIGSIAYFIVEVMPSLQNSPGARRALNRARTAMDPSRGVREGSLNYERSQNVESAARLAGELTKAGRHAEAIRICNEARTGLFEDDPKILLALANAQFAASEYESAVATLDYLRDKNPGFRSANGHLVYARALEENGATARALEEYAALVNYYIPAPKPACARRCSAKSSAISRAPTSSSQPFSTTRASRQSTSSAASVSGSSSPNASRADRRFVLQLLRTLQSFVSGHARPSALGPARSTPTSCAARSSH